MDESKSNFKAYMCGTDFLYESGQPLDGNSVYANMQDLLKEHPCCETDCGVVEVEICFKEWALPPSGLLARKT